MKKNFSVLITGRENVGKSSLFNRLIRKNKAIVDDFPGVTRDRIYADAEWLGRHFTLIDTGGLMFEGGDIIKEMVVKNITGMIKDVDLVLLVVDAQAGLLPDDRRVLDFIKKNAKDYAVVVNKTDDAEAERGMYDFYNLGVDSLLNVSAAHSRNLDELLDFIISKMGGAKGERAEEKEMRVAIIGKENVGKSSIFNAIIGEERSIVTDIPGTTRDSVDTLVEIEGRKVIFVDTAGVKKRKRIKEKAEEYSIGRAFANIKRAQIVVHVIDAIEGIQDMDQRTLGYAYEHLRGIIIVVNKCDLLNKKQKEEIKEKYLDYIAANFKFLTFAPVVFMSAKEGEGIDKLIEVVFYVENQYNFRVKTSVLNRVFSEAMAERQVSGKTGDLRVYYMTQVKAGPPEFAVFVNKKEKIHFSYMRFLENKIREKIGFEGVPIKFHLREKRKAEK